jgi:hypothetical protein
MLGPIGVGGAERAGWARSLGPTAEPEGVVGPIARRRAGLAKPLLQPETSNNQAVGRLNSAGAREMQ